MRKAEAAPARARESSPGVRNSAPLAQWQRTLGNRAVQRALSASAPEPDGADIAPEIAQGIAAQRGGGAALPQDVRANMENAFGADFSSVRVHAGAQAADLSRSLSARAFTTGADIFFARGAYDPGSRSGEKLIAHELTHVLQQTGGASVPSVQGKLTLGPENDAFEREADSAAENALRGAGGAPHSAGAASGTVQRWKEYRETAPELQMLPGIFVNAMLKGAWPEKYPDEAEAPASAALAALAASFSSYTDIYRDNRDADPVERMAMLETMYAQAYRLFDLTASEADWNDKAILHAARLMEFIRSIETEHIKVAELLAANPDLAPFTNDALDEAGRAKLLALWRSVVEGTGRLRVNYGPLAIDDEALPSPSPGDDFLRSEVLSYIARILGTKSGRKLIETIQSQPNEVIVTPSIPANAKGEWQDIYTASKGRFDSFNISDEGRGQKQEKRFAMMVPDAAGLYMNELDIDDYDRLQDIAKIVPSGEQAFVKAKPGLYKTPSFDLGAVKNEAGGDVKLEPSFLAFAHELDHAKRKTRGRDRSKQPLPADLSPMWSDPEEVSAIGYENKIAQEMQLDGNPYMRQRKWHRPTYEVGSWQGAVKTELARLEAERRR